MGANIWTTNDNALYTAGLGLANIFNKRKKPMVLISGVIGTLLSVWLNYHFCGWLNILNCTLPPVGIILVVSYFMNKKAYDTDTFNLEWHISPISAPDGSADSFIVSFPGFIPSAGQA